MHESITHTQIHTTNRGACVQKFKGAHVLASLDATIDGGPSALAPDKSPGLTLTPRGYGLIEDGGRFVLAMPFGPLSASSFTSLAV